MKRTAIFGLIASLAAAGVVVPALAQDGAMKMDGMEGMKSMDMSCCEEMAHGIGVVNSVDADARKVNLTHDPIEKIGWGKMTMGFAVGDKVDLAKFKKGDNVHFMLKKNDAGAYDVAMMCPIEGDPEAFKASMKKMMDGGMMEGMKDGKPGMSCMKDARDESGGADASPHKH
ncbi:MAG: copper-binding protein [Parvularculaceae bacterium]